MGSVGWWDENWLTPSSRTESCTTSRKHSRNWRPPPTYNSCPRKPPLEPDRKNNSRRETAIFRPLLVLTNPFNTGPGRPPIPYGSGGKPYSPRPFPHLAPRARIKAPNEELTLNQRHALSAALSRGRMTRQTKLLKCPQTLETEPRK